MATTNGSAQEAFAPVLQAVNSMRDGRREEKKVAHEYLEKFQKSVSQDLISNRTHVAPGTHSFYR
jgi:hypothetical protein